MQTNHTKNHSPSATERMVASQLSTIGLILVLIGMACLTWLKWVVPLFLTIMILVMAIFIFIQAARVRRASPHLVIALIALGLTLASFTWQPDGSIRGGGLPLQYVIDIPFITFHDRLGTEDEFRPWAFVFDVSFFIALGELFHYLYLRYTAKRRQG